MEEYRISADGIIELDEAELRKMHAIDSMAVKVTTPRPNPPRRY